MNDTLFPYASHPDHYPNDDLPSPSLPVSAQELQQEITHLQEMIGLLQSYERECIGKLDLKGAKETRGRIEKLNEKEQEIRDQILAITQDQKALEMSQEQEDLIHCFDRVWSQHLNELVTSLADGEQQLRNEQKIKRQEVNQRFDQEKINGFKPSTKLTNLRRKVIGLMKLHSYEDAEFESGKAKKLEGDQRKNWQERTQQRRKNALELFSRKSAKDFEVLRSKNEDILYRKMSERDAKFAILLKKHQVKRVQASRSTKELMKSISVTSLNTKRFQ